MKPTADVLEKIEPSIQDTEEKAIFLGGDAIALYPAKMRVQKVH